jgi:hypothetical protein
VERLNAKVGYCLEAACGSDLLFAEAMWGGTRRRSSTSSCPSTPNDFYSTSVDFDLPEMIPWRRRFDGVLSAAKTKRNVTLHYATTDHYQSDDVFFEFVNTVTQGLGIIRAAERGTEPHALVVSSTTSATSAGPGGTAYFVECWKRTRGTSKLSGSTWPQQRAGLDLTPRPGGEAPAPRPGGPPREPATAPGHGSSPSQGVQQLEPRAIPPVIRTFLTR